jgi:arginine/lysine/ornithine decarboxylase
MSGASEPRLAGLNPPRLSRQTLLLEMAEIWNTNPPSEWVPLKRSAGRISAGFVIPYPPGSPLIIPGQLISEEVVEFLVFIIELGGEVLGTTNGNIRVLKEV